MEETFGPVQTSESATLDSDDECFERLTVLERESNTHGKGRQAAAAGHLAVHRLGKRWLYAKRGDWRRWIASTRVEGGS